MRFVPLAILGIAVTLSAHAQEPSAVRLYAAGSLQSALTELAGAFTAQRHIRVETVLGPSGLLRERIAAGEAGDVFASADLKNPTALNAEGKAGPVVVFARNRLCVMARPGLAPTPGTLLAAMLDPEIRVGTSTPHSDPSGDYAWQMFAKADGLVAGSRAKLEAKAIKLMGGPDSPRPPADTNVYAWHLREGRADLFLGYCTGGREAAAQYPGVTVVNLPRELAVGADYGLTILANADAVKAAQLAMFILSVDGQRILARHGFDAPLITSPDP